MDRVTYRVACTKLKMTSTSRYMLSSFDFLIILASKLDVIMENRMDRRTEKRRRNERRLPADRTGARPVIVPPLSDTWLILAKNYKLS